MARKEKQYHFIYKTTNLLNGKYYYGMHSTDDLNDGYLGSGKRLRYSINKHGKENHVREIIEFLPNRILLAEREKEIVNLNEIANEDCLNLMIGGEGGFVSDEQQKQRSIIASNVRLKKMKEDKIFYENFCKAISAGVSKAYALNKIKKRKSNGWRGKKHSETTKMKMRESKKCFNVGKNNPQYGTMWITNGYRNTKIKKEEVIPENWRKGRI